MSAVVLAGTVVAVGACVVAAVGLLCRSHGKYSHVGVPSFHPCHTIHLPTCYKYPKHPKFPYFPISVAPSLGSEHIYIGSLTFSLEPDEAASVWRQ